MASGGVLLSNFVNSSNNGTTPSDKQPTTIAVFCGASPGNSPAYLSAARDLAQVFHENNIKLYFGGGSSGLMGEVARNLVALSGPQSVHGIIPAPLLQYERASDGGARSDIKGNIVLPDELKYGQTTVVKDMHTRKQMMAQAVIAGGPGSGFIALPGGYGTLEELMEIVTWNQIGIHARGIVVMNIEGYWNGLLSWVQDSVEEGFVQRGDKNIIMKAENASEAIQALRSYTRNAGSMQLQWGNE